MPIEEKRTLKPIPSPSGCGNSEKSRAPVGAQPQAGGYRYGRWVGLDHQSKATQNKSSPGLSVERAYFKIRPGRTTCAYGTDTYREIFRRECASRQASARFAGKFCPQGASTPKRVLRTIQRGVLGCGAEALPAAETAEAEQGQPSKYASGLRPAPHIWATATWSSAPVFASGHRPALQKPAKRKRERCRGRNFCPAHAGRNGFPLEAPA